MFDYLYVPEIVCYEGEETAAATEAAATAAAAAATAAATAAGAKPADGKTFSQEEVNKFLAEDRRKHTEKLKTLENSYESLLADKDLASSKRVQLETELEDVRSQFRTKEQEIEHQKKKQAAEYEGKLKEATESAQKYEGLYTSFVIDSAIRDAAIKEEAFNAEHIASLLRPVTKLQEVMDESGKPTGRVAPMTKFNDIDVDTGEPIETLRTPADAVKRMKELPDLHGCLFRANVVSGVGQGAATGGVTPGQGGQIDVTKLSSEQYRKLRKENPALLGLKPR